MFIESLLESGRHPRRSAWPAFWSVFAQSSLLFLLVLVPLLDPAPFVLPDLAPLVRISELPSTPPVPPKEQPYTSNHSSGTDVPHFTQPSGPSSPEPGPAPVLPWGLPHVSNTILIGLPGPVTNISPPTHGTRPSPPPQLVKPSVLMEGNLLYKVQPVYPLIARQMHLQGTVQLHAVIGADGLVRDVDVVSGAPLLSQAAVAAVRLWRYRPYLLNGQPIEVQSQITVKFVIPN